MNILDRTCKVLVRQFNMIALTLGLFTIYSGIFSYLTPYFAYQLFLDSSWSAISLPEALLLLLFWISTITMLTIGFILATTITKQEVDRSRDSFFTLLRTALALCGHLLAKMAPILIASWLSLFWVAQLAWYFHYMLPTHQFAITIGRSVLTLSLLAFLLWYTRWYFFVVPLYVFGRCDSVEKAMAQSRKIVMENDEEVVEYGILLSIFLLILPYILALMGILLRVRATELLSGWVTKVLVADTLYLFWLFSSICWTAWFLKIEKKVKSK